MPHMRTGTAFRTLRHREDAAAPDGNNEMGRLTADTVHQSKPPQGHGLPSSSITSENQVGTK